MRLIDRLMGNDADVYFNKNGHRCMDIDNINLKNYILFAGDNNFLGLDKRLEDTLPYLLSKKIGLDYYNLCVFNGGADIIKHNLVSWFTKYRAPKYLIVDTVFVNSIVVSDKNNTHYSIPDYNNETIKKLIDSANNVGFFAARNILLENILHSYISVPIYQIIVEGTIPIFTRNVTSVTVKNFDHYFLAEEIGNKIINQKKKAKP